MKLEQFFFCSPVLVFLIRPRNEYPVVGFIAPHGVRRQEEEEEETGKRPGEGIAGPNGRTGDIDGVAVSPTFPLKEIRGRRAIAKAARNCIKPGERV
jgi:hypothetical protein